jgi:hypothetical protein
MRNRRRHNAVESRDSIGRDEQKLALVDLINVAHLASMNERQAGKIRFRNGLNGGHYFILWFYLLNEKTVVTNFITKTCFRKGSAP